jgi:hypothetical protein
MYNIKGGKENKREEKNENLQKCFRSIFKRKIKIKMKLFIGEVIVGVGEVVIVVMDRGGIKIDVNRRPSTLLIVYTSKLPFFPHCISKYVKKKKTF